MSITESNETKPLGPIQRIPLRMPPVGSPRDQRKMSWQVRARHLSALGRAITLRAAEFLPSVYNPQAHVALEQISKALDYACESFGLDLDLGMPPTGLPPIANDAVRDDFFGAGKSILGSLVSFTDALAGLIIESMEIVRGADGAYVECDDATCLARFKQNEALRHRWERLFFRFSGVEFTDVPPDPPLSDEQTTIKYQLTSAMEVFVLGREYGHHAIRHAGASRLLRGSHQGKFVREFEADELAFLLGSFLGARGYSGSVSNYRNTWMESGAGAVAVLRATEAYRRVRGVLTSGTHLDEGLLERPTHVDRLLALEKWDTTSNGTLGQLFQRQRSLVGRLIPLIYNELKTHFPIARRYGLLPQHEEARAKALDAIRAGTAGEGLVEIIAKELPISPAVPTTSPNDLSRFAAQLKLSAAGDVGISVREYLQHRQDKSLVELAEHAVNTEIGSALPNVATRLAEKLRTGKNANESGFQGLLDLYAVWIEDACTKLGLPLHGGVACGIVWGPAYDPLQQNFFNTDVSRIEIPETTLMLCHYVSKLLSRTLNIRKEGSRLAFEIDHAIVSAKLQSNVELRKYASSFYAMLATGDRRSFKPMRTLSGKRKTVYWHLLTASEVFILAHEYAHHILEHKSDGVAAVEDGDNEELKAQELEADLLAALIVAHIGHDVKNPIAHLGAGALALSAVDILRRARSVLSTGVVPADVSPTHPSLQERLENFGALRYDPRNLQAAQNMQKRLSGVVEAIWTSILSELQNMHACGYRPLSSIPADLQWLRFGPAAELA